MSRRIVSRKGALPGTPLGRKKIYLPNFTLTLLRTPFLPPDHASFIVPLNLNKFDIRDYLYHAYGVRVISVRSFVQQQKVQDDRPNARIPAQNRHYRPRAIKKMTVLMHKPFVWPEEPEDLSPWDKQAFDDQNDENEPGSQMDPKRGERPSPERRPIAEQAQQLLDGSRPWKPRWEDVGEAVEVDQDIDVSSEPQPR
ncbi:MAG: hypothetical protein M1825_003174 [Sarcosagium campestre]|nr:MAG: hypothetical protein M1825_003174 [Sarcosagium campestre]